MITRETIDEVKNRIDIVDVVGDFITLKRSGQNYKALSPFSNEKTASFYVVPAKGIFKDFSSGKGGDSITFVMEHEGMSYLEAIRFLAKKYGVEIQENAASDNELAARNERDSLYIIMNYAKDYYKDLLHNHEEGQSIGLSYFHERGVTEKSLEKFELGYTLDSWNAFSQKAVAAGYSEDILEKAGLLIRRDDGKKYDRFRGRVIFPVHNLSGKVVAFGARILTKEKDQPKYINSPETEIYHKSNVLYGMFQAKNAIRREDFCYLVEGYTDVISLHQADVDNAVASSGTALTEEQIKLIRRFTENVTVLFDGDAAGIKAALRGIDLVLKGGLNVRTVLLPDGDDPDSFSKKMGSTELKKYLKENTKDFISFKIDLYAADAARDPIKKAEAIREIVQSISVIPDAIKRSVYLQETARLLNMQESVLVSEMNKILISDRKKKDQDRGREAVMQEGPPVEDFMPDEATTRSRQDPTSMVVVQERESIRLLLNYAELAYEEDQRLVDFMLAELEEVEFLDPTLKDIYAIFKEGTDQGQVVDTLYLMEHGSTEMKNLVAELTTNRHEVSRHWKEDHQIFFPEEKEILNKVAYTNVLRLKFRLIQKLIMENLAAWKQAGPDDDIEQYFTMHENLKGAEKQLASILGIVIPR